MALSQRAALLVLALNACKTISEPCETVSFFFDATLTVNGVSGAGQYQGGTSPMGIGVPAYAALDSTLFTDTPGAAAVRIASHTLLGQDRSGVLTLAFAAPVAVGREYLVGGLTREIETAPHILHAGREAEAGLNIFSETTDSSEGNIRVVRRDPLTLSFDVTFRHANSPSTRIGGTMRVIRREGPLRCD